MTEYIDLINHCQSMKELEFFIKLPRFYCTNPSYWYAIQYRNNVLIRQDPTRQSVLTDEFWNAMPANFLESQGEVEEAPAEDLDELWLPAQQWQHGGANAVEDPGNFYILGEPQIKNIPNFHTQAQARTLRFHNLNQADDIGTVVAAAFDEVINDAAGDDPRAQVGIVLHHPALDTPLTIPFSHRDEISGEALLHEVERLQQSATAVGLDEQMRIEVTRVIPPAGSGHKLEFRGDWQPWFNSHCGHGGCFIPIKNRDHLCCARAIITAKARLHKDEGVEARSRYETIRKGDANRYTAQREAARQLMQAAGLQDFKEACGLPELKKLQEALGQEYQLKVFWKENFNRVYYQGPEAARIIHLYLHHDHYDVITSVASFFNRGYYCDNCNKEYDHMDDHRCKKKCFACMRVGKDFPCSFEKWIQCSECHRHFPSQACFDAHAVKKSTTVGRRDKRRRVETSICQRFSFCLQCMKTINHNNLKGRQHNCGQTFCHNCLDYANANHKCYIQPIVDKQDKTPARFIFFDFESQTTEKVVGENINGPIYEHVPNLCVVQQACDICKDMFAADTTCQACGHLQHIFKGTNCKEQFCKWLFSSENKGSTAIAHNAKGYDAQFLMQYLHEQSVKPKVVLTGRKVMSLEACGIKVLDSLNFLPMSLESFPKAFGLTELKKGFFPHGFNRQSNEGYVGEWPPLTDYWPNLMKAEKRTRLEKWHADQQDKQFDFDMELLSYCISDVTLLREGCLKFRRLYIEETGVDPFIRATTIAAGCNYVYRRNFLKPNTIGLIPNGGYRREAKQSVVALKWFKWITHSQHMQIQHANNGGEKRIGPYHVDGYNCDTNTIYEFHGCAWHGCIHCYPKRDKKLPNGLTAADAFERTVARRLAIERQGYTVEEMWECDLNRQLRANSEMKCFFKEQQIHEPLDPRDAFFGGRTNAIKLYHKCQENEKIEYKDVISLYPWTNKYGAFPIGHPLIMTEGHDAYNIATHRQVKGLIKCRILPPRQLLHPLLPRRSNGKLCFPLCGKCADDCSNTECSHSDEERAFWGTWATLELYAALDLGYQLLDVVETWHYDKWAEYDGKDPDSGLFTRYINTFLKLKQQASGWPSHAKTDTEKEAYIKEYEQKEGIQLDPTRIEFNAGLRQLSKLCLNSFWGKFGQRNNLTKTAYFTDVGEYMNLFLDTENEVSTSMAVSDHMVCVTYKKREEFIDVLPNTNMLIALYTTCHARLKLYSYLHELGDRCLYFDTDSVIYTTREGEASLPTGVYLGELSDELSDGDYISEFVGAGPKQYAYKVVTPDKDGAKFTVKVRGFDINSDTAIKINFDNMKRKVKAFVQYGDNESVQIYMPKISIKCDKTVVTEIVSKRYKVVYTKRRILSDYTTLPFGY